MDGLSVEITCGKGTVK